MSFLNLEQIPEFREFVDKERVQIDVLFGNNTNIHVSDQYEYLYINLEE